MKRLLALAFALGALALRPLLAGPIALPIYIEDNHAGSFYWLADQLDLEEPCTLLHFDAHSDASGIFDSDLIRTQMRRVASRAERRRLLERWRSKGVVQCFDWIEPLMPAPIAEVIWIPRVRFEQESEARRLADTAGDFLDGHLEAAPRAAGGLRSRFSVMGLEQLRAKFSPQRAIVATIDLDSFANLSPNECEVAFERVWSYLSELRHLRAITIAISRPYLKSDEQADRLLTLALRAALSLPTATIRFEPFQTVAHDRSTRARAYRAEGREVPVFDLTKASPTLRALLLGNRERVAIIEGQARWENLARNWEQEAPAFRIALRDRQPSTDQVWRVPAAEPAVIELRSEPWDTPGEAVEWIVQLPRYLRCNLSETDAERIGFAQGAPPRPRWREVVLPESGTALPLASLREFFDQRTGCGAIRLRARVTTSKWVRETPAVEIRRFVHTGFRAAVTEQFGLPYLFGSGQMRDGGNTGPETGWGADCANFLIYALRRQGLRVPWSNPKQFRQHLAMSAEGVTLAAAPTFSAEELERGLILHLGSHVAALMEDRAPLGVANSEDIVAHQLEGAPALLSLGELLRARNVTRFDLLRVPAPAVPNTLLIGGDVMLGRSVGERIKAGVDPLAGIRPALERAGTKIVNLECVVSDHGSPAADRKFHFRAPLAAASALADAGINVVGVANNHATDFGAEAQLDAVEHLRAAGLSVIGGSKDDAPAFQKIANGSQIAMLALNDVAAGMLDRPRLARALAKAEGEARFVIALVHWGEENTPLVTEQQRELARWLIDHGVDFIAGSHPHCLQPLDFYHGRPIIYSLGNLVFDGAPTVAAWNSGHLAEVGFDGPSTSLRLVPVHLDADGLPHLARPIPAVAAEKAPGESLVLGPGKGP
ncbi:MAG TPA: CapA family protein [Chthoniobacterales bacterium]|nr:CapA family protein [Chthoniobacterales bacterium]